MHYNCSLYLRFSAHGSLTNHRAPRLPGRPGTWTRLAARTIVTSHSYWFQYFGIFAFTTNEALHCQ